MPGSAGVLTNPAGRSGTRHGLWVATRFVRVDTAVKALSGARGGAHRANTSRSNLASRACKGYKLQTLCPKPRAKYSSPSTVPPNPRDTASSSIASVATDSSDAGVVWWRRHRAKRRKRTRSLLHGLAGLLALVRCRTPPRTPLTAPSLPLSAAVSLRLCVLVRHRPSLHRVACRPLQRNAWS